MIFFCQSLFRWIKAERLHLNYSRNWFLMNLKLNLKLRKYMTFKNANSRRCSLVQNLKIPGNFYLLLEYLDRGWTRNCSIELLNCCDCKKLYMMLKNTNSSFVQKLKSPKVFLYCFEFLTERCIGIRTYFTELTERRILKATSILQKVSLVNKFNSLTYFYLPQVRKVK